MRFVYIDKDGNEVGPLEQSTVERAIEDGVITQETAIRNCLLKDYRTIDDFPAFRPLVARIAAAKDPGGEIAAARETERKTGWKAILAAAGPKMKVVSSALSGGFTPRNVGIGRRVFAMATDALFLLLVAGIIFGIGFYRASGKGYIRMTPPEKLDIQIQLPASLLGEEKADKAVETEKKDAPPAEKPVQRAIPALDRVVKRGAEHNDDIARAAGAPKTEAKKDVPAPATAKAEGKDEPAPAETVSAPEEKLSGWTFEVLDAKGYHGILLGACWLFIPLLLLYYGIAYSVYAQTIGMWYWGMFLTRSDCEEVYGFRAFAYTVAMLFCGLLMIPMVLLSGRSLADWICGVRVINVYSAASSS